MKILHLIHSVDLRSGGPSISLRQVVQAQTARGHQVTILSTDAQSADPWVNDMQYRNQIMSDPAFEGCTIYICRGYGRRGPFARFRYSPEAIHRLDRLFDSTSDHPDVVHIHGLFSHLTMFGARHCTHWNIPYVLRPAGGLNQLSRRHGRIFVKHLLYKMIEKKNLERAIFIQATSQREKDELQELLPYSRINIVPHGMVIPVRDISTYARQVFYRKFPQFQGRRTILYLSRITAKKRLDLLINAFAQLREQFPEAMLAVAGSNAGYRAKAKQLVRQHKLEDRVIFLGFLTGTLKEGAFSAAHALALPSQDENFGLVIVEAMAHGVPVLVSENVDSYVYVKKAKAGIVVKPNLKSVTRGMEKLLTRDMKPYGQRGRDYAREHLSWDGIVNILDELYVSK